MKRTNAIRYILIILIALVVGILTARAVTVSAEEEIRKADEIIEATPEYTTEEEPETVSLSYTEWQEQQTQPDVYEMDVWTLGEYLYGISANDTSRALKIITYEGYADSPLSYYVACCCWVRATEGYWGYSNLYSAFGEADTSYDEWMDCIEVAGWAYDYLKWCYLEPSYVRYCNGMVVPEAWVYEENGIYCWN